jgi:hypothetical protein
MDAFEGAVMLIGAPPDALAYRRAAPKRIKL